VVAQMCRYPEVLEYIKEVIHNLKPWLNKNLLEKILFVVVDKEGFPLERFVFDITGNLVIKLEIDSNLFSAKY